ncbi:Tigger transposable element-derived protein 7-like 7 [Homarus americanus]|uniref:Tigger transposable element-derived protein 7-like 7 n=1 Tax=Homarus americanus TaxID=6706 RepID=A0A8J5NEB1_HOMAM|nr:Tigger transposable element-derived protein 7-like 7 [Homarus americanus]
MLECGLVVLEGVLVNKSMPSKETIRKRVRRDKPVEGVVESSSKKPRLDKEEKKGKVEEVVEKNSAVDITQRWLVEKLNAETVANLVMVTMKLELIRKLEAGASVARVCDEFGVKKQTVSDIRKAKDKLTAFSLKYNVDATSKSSSAGARKHMRVAKDTNLEEAVTKWLVQQRSCGNVVRGVEIQAAAVKLASHMGIENFEACDGWLWRFRNRHGMCNNITHGEAGSAPTEDIEPFRDRLNDLIKSEGLLISQVYNVDESGLYWRSLPRNTQAFKNEASSPGRKVSKERFSALCCANADGMHRLNRDSEDEEDEEPLPKKPKLSVIRESLDNVISYIELSAETDDIQHYYQHIRALRELIIQRQHHQGKQPKLDSFFKPVCSNPAAAVEPAADSGHPHCGVIQLDDHGILLPSCCSCGVGWMIWGIGDIVATVVLYSWTITGVIDDILLRLWCCWMIYGLNLPDEMPACSVQGTVLSQLLEQHHKYGMWPRLIAAQLTA